ncbi:MAG: sensor domain-containing diguanylate cyclase [Lachnospiraceae bacterium]|nr:sensor domain-containing diguanylate cyclase [Lachnospiraceae bacterium]
MNCWENEMEQKFDISDYHRLKFLGKDAEEILPLLLDHMTAGVGLFEMTDTIHALYLNQAFFDCIGYTKEAYACNINDIYATLYPEDVSGFANAISMLCPQKENISYSLRGYRQDGSLGWFDIQGVAVDNHISDNPLYLVVVHDITQQKEAEDRIQELNRLNAELLLQEERYHILEATTQGVLFEYFPDKDTMVFSYNLPNNKKRREVPNYQDYLKHSPMVHSEHIKMFKEALQKACMTETEGDLEYLSTVSGGGYRWTATHYKSVAGPDGRILSVMGRICDIHDSKMEKERINYRAEIDGLTKVYRKDIAFEKMEELVREAPNSRYYFIILDLDDFKQINDKYGHQYGDEVLKDVSSSLQSTFAENAIIGRFGGDEFIVLTKDLSLEDIRMRLKISQMTTSYCAGIAPWNANSTSQSVFQIADKAMYQVKSSGKNGIAYMEE